MAFHRIVATRHRHGSYMGNGWLLYCGEQEGCYLAKALNV